MDDRITISGGRMRVAFDSFGIDDYARFLRAKALPEYEVEFDRQRETYAITAPARFASMMGLDVPDWDPGDLPLSSFLFDDQTFVTRTALEAMCYAVWAECGFGKTLVGLEWGRQVNHRTRGRVLYFTRNEIVQQWLDMARQFYGDALPLLKLDNRADMKAWARDGAPGLAIANYEKLNYAAEGAEGQIVREFAHLAGVCLDEGSRLRTAGGKQKWALIKSCEQIPYRLILTATPAPNNLAEFMSQAGFLGKFRAEQSINTYFSRDHKTHRWTVKPHARAAFFKFMSTWSVYIRDPRRYGWRHGFAAVPEPIITTHAVPVTDEQLTEKRRLLAGGTGRLDLFAATDTNVIQRGKLSQYAKGFKYLKAATKGGAKKVKLIESNKPGVVADLVRSEVAGGLQVLVWTVFDAESDIIADRLGDTVKFEMLTGKTPRRLRAEILERFRLGETPVVISRASMLGFGMNLQHVGSMIFSGFNDGYEAWYQALRRAFRYGQKLRLRVHVPIVDELEGDTWSNLLAKHAEHEAGVAEMEANYVASMQSTGQLKGLAA